MRWLETCCTKRSAWARGARTARAVRQCVKAVFMSQLCVGGRRGNTDIRTANPDNLRGHRSARLDSSVRCLRTLDRRSAKPRMNAGRAPRVASGKGGPRKLTRDMLLEIGAAPAEIRPPIVRKILFGSALRVHSISSGPRSCFGMRRAELVALRWADVDLETGLYSVRRSAKVVGHEVVVGTTKTRGSTRSDVLPAFVVDALRRYRAAQRKRHLALGVGNLGPDAYVFHRLGGTIWHPNHVSQRFSRLVQRAKLPTMRFHDLRHGFASLAFAAGVPLKVVSESLGHSGIAITAQTYVHARPSQTREVRSAGCLPWRRVRSCVGGRLRSLVTNPRLKSRPAALIFTLFAAFLSIAEGWRERVGIEPTSPLAKASTVLKTARATRPVRSHISVHALKTSFGRDRSLPRPVLRCLLREAGSSWLRIGCNEEDTRRAP